jgi:hypothetical protein
MTYIPIPLAGYAASVRIDGNVLYNTKWTVTPETNELPVNSMEGGGFEDVIPGLRKCSITVEGWWDYGANQFDAPMQIQDGNVLHNVFLYVSGTSSPFWSFPYVLIGSAPMTADVNDEIKYSFTAKAKGSFTYPTGSGASGNLYLV